MSNSEPTENGERRVSSSFGLLAAVANSGTLVERLDGLISSYMDDSAEPEVKEPAFDELVGELADLHGLAIDVWEGLQQLQNDFIEDL